MAVNKDDSMFSSLEVQWLRKCVEYQRQALVRSASKEMAGSEIHSLRMKEIKALADLLLKLG